MIDERKLLDAIEAEIAELQKRLKRTGVVCEHCGKPGASAQDEAVHNTGDCHCPSSRALCWREWWVNRCQPDEAPSGS